MELLGAFLELLEASSELLGGVFKRSEAVFEAFGAFLKLVGDFVELLRASSRVHFGMVKFCEACFDRRSVFEARLDIFHAF